MESTQLASASANMKLPAILGSLQSDGHTVSISNDNVEADISLSDVGAELLGQVLHKCDGKTAFGAIMDSVPEVSRTRIHEALSALVDTGLMIDRAPPEARTGLDVLLEIEDLTNRLLYETLYKNVFWQNCKAATSHEDMPRNVMYGLVIENYHLLFRESYFDAPVLSYVGNTKARLAMNAFFAEENGHDELLLKSLNHIGLSRDELFDSRPLPQTMALINALAYWAHNDPIFFFTTLGVLEGKDIQEDSFIAAAERIGMDDDFVKPVKTHSNLNLGGQHGNLTRQIFQNMPVIDDETIRRLRAQTYLFIELYDAFFRGIWEHYSVADKLLRPTATL